MTNDLVTYPLRSGDYLTLNTLNNSIQPEEPPDENGSTYTTLQPMQHNIVNINKSLLTF